MLWLGVIVFAWLHYFDFFSVFRCHILDYSFEEGDLVGNHRAMETAQQTISVQLPSVVLRLLQGIPHLLECALQFCLSRFTFCAQ